MLEITEEGISLSGYLHPPTKKYRVEYYRKNRIKLLQRQKIYQYNHKKEIQIYMRKYYYGIDEKSYNKMFKLQGNVCAICKSINCNFHVDHNHITKKFRGILCSNCNRSLGLLKESLENVLAMVEYLKRDSLNA